MNHDRKARRAAALKCMSGFRASNNITSTPIRIERRAGGIIMLIGRTDDGRDYGVGYSAMA